MPFFSKPCRGTEDPEKVCNGYSESAQTPSRWQAEWRSQALLVIYTGIAFVHSFGIYPRMRTAYALVHDGTLLREDQVDVMEINRNNGSRTSSVMFPMPMLHAPRQLTRNERAQWDVYISQLLATWAMTCRGHNLLLPLSLGFFQINGVDENMYARTAVLSALLCSGIGLLTCNWYISMEDLFRGEKALHFWLEASSASTNRPPGKREIDFWMLLSLPISLTAWSIFFCLVAIVIVIIPSSTAESLACNIACAVFLILVVFSQLFQVYRVSILIFMNLK